MQPSLKITLLAASVCAALSMASPAVADDKKGEGESETITIIGDRNAAQKVPGSAHVVSEQELEEFKYTDINRALQQIPGVYLQLEDGLGLRPNIGLRGTGTERTGRITLMEDGVLIAPAPYAASSAYYFPTFDRITGMEVLKGPAAIKYGPFTVGGAVNLLSRQVPVDAEGQLKLEIGENSERRAHFYYGDGSDNFGYLVEANKHQSDGFKTIDRKGQETGFDKDDYLVKFRLNNDYGSGVYQQLDFKIQHSTEDSEQSYLGLTDADYAANPYRMYGVSELDNFDGEHDQYAINYYADLTDSVDFRVTAYRNETKRNWFKTEALHVAGSRNSWANVVGALNDPTNNTNDVYFQSVLDGADTAAGDQIEVRANNRAYVSRGVQARLDWDFTTGSAEHEMEFGIRVHKDEEDRFQRNSFYVQQNGGLVLDDLGAWGNAGNRVQSAEATSYFITDKITVGDWILTPGVRYEDIDLERQDWGKTSTRLDADLSTRSNSVSQVLPGFGALWSFNDNASLLFGINKGFTPPGNSPDSEPEESWNYELGMRFGNGTYTSEIIAFYSDYDNILGECTQSNSGCDVNNQGDKFNGGEAEVKGVELQVIGEFAKNWPVRFTYTYTDTEFGSTFENEAWGDVTIGDSIPYIPEQQAQLSLGYDNSVWNLFTNINYVDGVCTKPACGAFQQTDSRLIVDLAGEYKFSDAVAIYATIDNLFEDDGIVAREPYGARPDKPRTARVGVRFNF
ncbi:MAG: TonB-dependent receptor [Kangiellaceae bacterium]|nr:TonB-dependent receptor [Kangiellaceae bacterium]